MVKQNYGDGNPVYTVNDGTLRDVVGGSIFSVKTPNFKTTPKGNLPWNPFTYTYSKTYRRQGSIDYLLPGKHVTLTGFDRGDIYPYLSTYAGTGWTAPNAELPLAKARSAVLQMMKNQTINVAQAFAERKQTVNLISTSVNRLASAAIAIRRGNLRHAEVVLFGKKVKNFRFKDVQPSRDNLANYWLEYQYGWRPLLSDIYGACEMIANTYHRSKPTTFKKTILLHPTLGPEKVLVEFNVGFLSYGTLKEYGRLETSGKATVGIQVVEDDAVRTALSQTGLTNPLQLAWELVPYSFVIDWFAPVGTYLSNIDSPCGYKFVRGFETSVITACGTSYYKETMRQGSWNAYYQGYEYLFIEGPVTEYYHISKKRDILSTFPKNTFYIDPKLGTSRILSAISLLNQAFKR